MGKYDNLAKDITFNPPRRHPLTGKDVKVQTDDGIWQDAKIIHVYGDNQFYLVVMTDYQYFMNRRFECLRRKYVRIKED
jgi:hypothetical protein